METRGELAKTWLMRLLDGASLDEIERIPTARIVRDLPELIGFKGPGEKVRLEVVRGKERRTVTVTLAPRPSPPPAG